jgi:hypothetical protein
MASLWPNIVALAVIALVFFVAAVALIRKQED